MVNNREIVVDVSTQHVCITNVNQDLPVVLSPGFPASMHPRYTPQPVSINPMLCGGIDKGGGYVLGNESGRTSDGSG